MRSTDSDRFVLPDPLPAPTEQARWFSDSAVPLISLATDAHNLLIDEFAAHHGRDFLVRAPDHERLALLQLTDAPSSSRPTMLSDTWVYKMPPNRESLTVGRDGHDLGIADATVEVDHATIDLASEPPTVTDRGSTYGTWVGFEMVQPHLPTPILFDRDLRFGLVSLMTMTTPVMVKVLRALYPRC